MAALQQLRDWRVDASKGSNPDEILKLAKPLITTGRITAAGDESWDIYEQTLCAALETSDDSLALECLVRLSDRFPQSGRVHALRGMVLEATQDPKEALKFYDKVLSVEPTNVPVIKRRITFMKSLGKIGDAIRFLVEYLDTYYADPDAWAELGNMYYDISQFERAAFCWSEVVLLKPHDHEINARYADVLYAQSLQQGDVSLMHTAARGYLRSIELCDDYLRGFCGVKTCCTHLLKGYGQSAANDKAVSRSVVSSETSSKMIPVDIIKALDMMSTAKIVESRQTLSADAHNDELRTFINSLISSGSPATR